MSDRKQNEDPGEEDSGDEAGAGGDPVSKPGADSSRARARARRRLADRVGGKERGAKGKKRGARSGEPSRRTNDEKLNRPERQAEESEKSEKRDKRGAEARAAEGGRKSKRAGGPAGKARRAGGGERAEADKRPRAGKRRRGPADVARRDRESSRRRRARPARHRAKASAAALAGTLKRGAGWARRRVAAAAPKAGRAVLAALGAVFALFFALLGLVLSVMIAVGGVLAGPVGAVLRALDRAARRASRLLTPARALAAVVAGAAILLALSQYADYRSVSIGNDAYSGVQTVAPAPETDRLQAGDPHSYAFVPIAIACLGLLAAALLGGRWRLLRLVTLAGVAAIVIALLVDRPAGLDPGVTAVSFEGVRATLIGGFYAQIAAGVLLIGSSTLLARELRLAGKAKASPASERSGLPERFERRRGSGAPGSAQA
ncbi:MAG TPA: hypothetical protein VFH44_11505 [Solirubrobacterales bacterium]|nr:hypothetical protein [Solirubrobacterales bacterium]